MEAPTESHPVRANWPDDTYAKELFNFRSYDEARINALANEFTGAKPFPHIVINNFLAVPSEFVTDAFPRPDWPGWHGFDDAYQHNKHVCGNIDALPPLFQAMVQELNSPAFLAFLERVTGIKGLIPDPYLNGGGLHSSGPGGILAPHADFHHYGRLALFRRINVLVYFNQGWQREQGGCLELYAKGANQPEKDVVPEFGRMVMFLTDDRSIHGFTRPVSGANRWRNSLALYYYTSEDAEQFSGDSDTHWKMHGKQDGADFVRLVTYKGLLRIARLFSILAHRANPNFRRGARPVSRDY